MSIAIVRMPLGGNGDGVIEHKSRRARRACACVILAALALGAYAADRYPTRPVRLIVPFTPGGAAEIIARLMGAQMSQALGQPFVVDTRPGGGTVLGTEIVARAAPDGYTLGLLATSLALNTGLLPKLPYHAMKDFAPITLAVDTPLIYVVPSALPVKSMRELIATAKAKPGAMIFGSSGQGTSGHLAIELLMYRAGIKLLHVPYKGAGQALVDLIAGQVNLVCTSTLPALPPVRSGQLRALAVTTAKRSSAAPEVPTVAEAAGMPGYRASTWYALFAPALTPESTLGALHRAATAALKTPSVSGKLAVYGGEVIGSSPQELREFMQSEIAVWSNIIKVANIRPGA